MLRASQIAVGSLLGLLFACNANVPFDPSSFIPPIDEAIDNVGRILEDALADPLQAKPFPVIIGGDSERLFYATNLGDIRVNFPGPTNDIVIPGFFGPSNLYRFQDKERDLIRPLIPTGAVFGIATDGQFVAYITVTDDPEAPFAIVATPISHLDDRLVFDPRTDLGEQVVPTRLAIDNGRLAFVTRSEGSESATLHIEDLTGAEPSVELETGNIVALDLRNDRLVYIEAFQDGRGSVVLRDFLTDSSIVLAENLRTSGGKAPSTFVTANAVFWSEPLGDGLSRVRSYNLTDDTTRLFADAVIGTLAGADDSHIVTEESVDRGLRRANKIVVRRYGEDGREKVLNEFRADGLSGQTTVIGDRAVWVKPDRRIVIAPLGRGDRTSIQPF